MKKNPKASFRKGFVQLRQVDVPAFKARLLKALGLNNMNSFYDRLSGKIEPKMSEIETIENLFADYGITEVLGEA